MTGHREQETQGTLLLTKRGPGRQGQGGSNLAKAKLAPDPPDFFALQFSLTEHQFVTGCRISTRAIGVKLHFSCAFSFKGLRSKTGSCAPA